MNHLRWIADYYNADGRWIDQWAFDRFMSDRDAPLLAPETLPPHRRRVGVRRRKNLMNISSLIIPSWVKLAVPLAMTAAVLGGGYWLKSSRDSWKATAANEKNQIALLEATIRTMTTAQNTQAKVSTQTVTKVVQGPERIKTVIQHIHDAPIPKNCGTPDLAYAKDNT